MTPGERLFEAYLTENGLAFEREPGIGGRSPDFLVRIGGRDVACAVYEPVSLPPRQLQEDETRLSSTASIATQPEVPILDRKVWGDRSPADTST